MGVSSIDGFNEFTSLTRTILLKHNQEALESLSQISKVAEGTPTNTEIMQKVTPPMKEITDGIKNGWLA